jgi:hypothetical protein
MKNLFVLLALFLFNQVNAQDTIFQTDGTVLEAKVKEITSEEIRFTMSSNPDGPLYILQRSEVNRIKYKNGTQEQITTLGLSEIEDKKQTHFLLQSNKYKNVAALDVIGLFFTNLNLSYEYIFKDGNCGIRIPITIGIGELTNVKGYREGTYLLSRIWSAGADLNFYPKGQAIITYYLGPSLEAGAYTYGGGREFRFFTSVNNLYSLVLKNGLCFRPTEHLHITSSLGIGVKHDELNQRYAKKQIERRVTFEVNLGYRL